MDKNANIKKTKARLIISVLCFLFFVLIFGFIFWRGIYLPKNIEGQEQLFEIEQGEGLFQIADSLEQEGIIRNKIFFNFYILLKGAQGRLQSGNYSLSSSMIVPEIAQKIISGETFKIKITIPEGFTLKQIENHLDQIVPRSDLGTRLTGFTIGDFKEKFDFLEDAPGQASLEGFLFPDTYFFSPDVKDEEITEKFLANFDRKFTQELRGEMENQGKTIFEVITIASMIEKEVITKEDKELVSGILWKRLKAGIPLQVDATIAYILERENLSFEQMQREIALNRDIDSFYNTYRYAGLPQGPISNPGLESILAAVYPEESEYWYYLSTPEGKTIFSRTLQEHNIAKAKYL